MKHGIHIFIVVIGLLLFSCRGSKHEHNQYNRNISIEETNKTSRADSTRTEREDKDSTITTINSVEYTRTTTYRDSGGISSIQEQWRATGSAQLSVSSGRSSEVSIANENSDNSSTISEQESNREEIKTSSDNRLIQGSEWIYIALGIVIIIIALLTYFKFRKR
jgi:FtsZ-interacting cell division protein ZipA